MSDSDNHTDSDAAIVNDHTDSDAVIVHLVEVIAKALVDSPDEVTTNEISGTHSTVIELKVAKTDMGRIIGRKGSNARALKDIIAAASGKLHRKYILEIVE